MNVYVLFIVANVIGPGVRTTATPAGFTAYTSIQTVAVTGLPGTASAATGRRSGIVGVGIGYPPPGKRGAQGRLLAQRAAEVRATADLSRQLGVPASGRLCGVQYVSRRVRSDGRVEVVAMQRAR